MNVKKIMSVVAASAILLTGLSACSNDEKDQNVNASEEKKTVLSEEEKKNIIAVAAVDAKKYVEYVHDITAKNTLDNLPPEEKALLDKGSKRIRAWREMTAKEQEKLVEIQKRAHELGTYYYGVDQMSGEDIMGLAMTMRVTKILLSSRVGVGEDNVNVNVSIDEDRMSVSDDGSTVNVPPTAIHITFKGDSPASTEGVVMKKENGKWKVDPKKMISDGKKVMSGQTQNPLGM